MEAVIDQSNTPAAPDSQKRDLDGARPEREINPAADDGSEPRGSSEVAITKPGGLPSVSQIMQQPTVRRFMPGIALAMAALLMLIFWAVMTSAPYKSVSDGMQSADVQLALEALQGSNFSVRINKH